MSISLILLITALILLIIHVASGKVPHWIATLFVILSLLIPSVR